MPVDLRENLRERIAQGRVIVVVGAGVSIGASGGQQTASWKGLLESGIEHCEGLGVVPKGWAERKREDLATDDTISWLSVATEVQERLQDNAPGEFRDWLNTTVGALEAKDDSVLKALGDLDAPIATTNYDHLIEDASDRDAVTWQDFAEVQRVLQGDSEGVIHLHGSFKSPASVILGYRSYETLLKNEAAQALQKVAALSHSLLYVGLGASFEDPNFSHWQRWRREALGGQEVYRHFRLCLNQEVETVQAEHEGDERVFALGYGDDHDELAEFLRGLKSLHPETNPVAPEPPIQVASVRKIR